jgi:hypothetical protein
MLKKTTGTYSSKATKYLTQWGKEPFLVAQLVKKLLVSQGTRTTNSFKANLKRGLKLQEGARGSVVG